MEDFIKEVQNVRPDKDDIIVIKVDRKGHNVPMKVIHQVAENIKKQFPDNKVLFIPEFIKLEVLNKKEAKEALENLIGRLENDDE